MPAEHAPHSLWGFSLEAIAAAIGAVIASLLGFIVRGHREKIKEQDERIKQLGDCIHGHSTSIGVLTVQQAESERDRLEIWNEIKDLRIEIKGGIDTISHDVSEIRSTMSELNGRFSERSRRHSDDC